MNLKNFARKKGGKSTLRLTLIEVSIVVFILQSRVQELGTTQGEEHSATYFLLDLTRRLTATGRVPEPTG